MKTSIATVTLSGTLPRKLQAIAAAGFDGVEIFENDFLAFDGSPREVGRIVRDAGLQITLFQPFRDFEGMPEPQRSRTFDRAERKFDIMQELGTDLMLVCSNVSPLALGGIDRAAEDFRELGERAARRGLRVGYEALAWGRHISDHRDAWEIVRRADHPSVGLILDSFHTLARRIDVASIRAIPRDRIFIVQLADAPQIEMDLLHWSRHYRNMPGQGDLPVVEFMRAVAATGYDGVLSLEIFNDQFRGGSPKAIAVDGKRSLVSLMDRVRREEPGTRISVPQIPDRIRAEGIEFVEFAADEHEAAELSGLFRTLGFRKAGRHKSKDVTLWRQGNINLVINTEREGFAHSAYLMHGTSVCDIGLRVEDAAATVARARALGAEPFEQAVGPGELSIPAIRGVGGGVMHFIDGKSDLGRVWDIEFIPVADDGDTCEAGLTTVDHIAQTMNYEEMLTWILFYTSIFATRKTPMVDIVDPAGLVRSQVIENETGSLRITLNGAENRRTLAGHFIAESFGSAVQHIAFATDDIFATVAAMKANGFTPLAISPNYYDDIEVRFALEPELLDRLRAENILYDRDADGEYFQLYSPNYGEGFFFEIVQRRRYAGYGAPNAPFRIAAQKRGIRPKDRVEI
ncbi:MAG TPA: TIM barrel protein [Ferrovibrio sp.]|uniref:bifunctional sugar phosphate isomerase/epimerase/4-hydroxyphenylpyruvate dioxygenase family protein n=1 Tax=Ferrovibrio sp. TaxID=1917215 RepID=UPI002B4ABDFA|nr:TIM barrel protein [Ferrovibrio sp.]HLT76923.1 TIM barrel protein [Ferrovibrio sp.]